MEAIRTEEGFTKIKIDTRGKIILVVGGTGSGKSILLDSYASHFVRKFKGKVFYITEKPQSAMENAFMCLNNLSQQQKKSLTLYNVPDAEVFPHNIEIFHPFTFNFPKTPVPDVIKLFSFPIKDIDDDSWAALLGRDLDSPSVLLCQEVSERLKPEDDLFSFLFESYKMTSGEDTYEVKKTKSISERNMWLPFETFGGKRDINRIKLAAKKLQEDYFLQPDNCSLNLTEDSFAKMLNKTDIITMFTNWRIMDKKHRYFCTIEILKKLNKAIANHKHPPILIILEEIKILLPKTISEKEKYKNKLSEILREMLAGLRSSNVTVLASTQSYYETNSDFRDGVPNDQVALMKLSSEDIKSIGRDFRLNASNFNILVNLKVGEFVFFSEIQSTSNYADIFILPHVPFGHREPGYDDFIATFKKIYPERMISYREIITEVENKFKESSVQQEKRVRAWESKNKEQKPEPSEENPRIERELLAKYTKEQKDEIAKNFIPIIEKTPMTSWNGRLLLFDTDLSVVQVKKLVLEYSLEHSNYDFIRNYFQRKYIKSNYPEHFKIIFGEDETNQE